MSAPATRPDSSYLLRKLHSLSGIIPVGAFLAEHFWSNSAALVSAQKYNDVSQELQTIPFRPFVEWAAIFCRFVSRRVRHIHLATRQVERIGLSLGRELALHVSAIHRIDRICVHCVALVYRALAHARTFNVRVCGGRFVASAVSHFFVIGIVASSFHLGVGIWNFLCKWGLAATVRAQRAAGQLGALIGVTFSIVGILIVISFRFNWHPFASYIVNK